MSVETRKSRRICLQRLIKHQAMEMYGDVKAQLHTCFM